jgi:hypothetical protein
MFVNALLFRNNDIPERSQVHYITIILIHSYNFQHFPNVAIINFIKFSDICEAYTYTFYERYPPHNTNAQILDREKTDYDLNLGKYHSTLF